MPDIPVINKKNLLAIILSCSAFNVCADDLQAVYQAAQNFDTEIRAAYANYYANRQNVPINRAALLPQIDAEVGSSSGTRDTTTIVSGGVPIQPGERDSESSGWSVMLNQSLYDHANWVALRQAHLGAAQAEADYQSAKQQLILRVAEAYFNVLAAEDTLEFAGAEKKSVAQQLEQTRQRYDVGLIAITDVKESQASYDLAVAQEIQARNTLATNREALRAITNRYPEVLKTLNEAMPLASPEPENIEQWVDTATQKNTALLSSRFAFESAGKEVSRLRAGHYPSLSLRASKGFDNSVGQFGDDETETDSTSVGVTLSIPLFAGGGVSARVKQAVYREDAARETMEAQRRQIVQQTRNFYLTVIADISRIEALKQALASTQAAYEATNAGFEVGTRNSAEVLLALRDTFRAKRDYAQARYDYLLNTLRLKQAAGTLTGEDIIAINRWLE